MACNGLQINMPGGGTACIPYLVLPSWPPEPEPDPWWEVYRLGIINEMIQGLSQRTRAPLQQAIRNVSKELNQQLPQGVSFQLSDQEHCAD